MNQSNLPAPPFPGRTVLLPGALAPVHWLAAPGVRARLEQLNLTRWDLSPAVHDMATEPPTRQRRRLPHEHWLAEAFAWDSSVGPAQDWFAMPVSLTIGLDHLVLSSLDTPITDQEGRLLAQAIEPLLAESGVWLERHRLEPTEVWRLHFERALSVDGCSPLAALGKNTHALMPSGPDAGRWRKFAHEIEMAWHCAGPDLRFATAQPFPVNSLWLAGPVPANPGTQASPHASPPTSPRAFPCGSFRAHPFARITVIDAGSAITRAQIEACADLAESGPGQALWLDARALKPRLAGDLEGWIHALEAIDAGLATDNAVAQVVMSGTHTLRIWQSASRAPDAGKPAAFSIRVLAALVKRSLQRYPSNPNRGSAGDAGHVRQFFGEPSE